MNFELDLSELEQAFAHSPRIVGETVEDVLDEIKEDWVMEARDLAPIDSSNLRRQIKGRVEESGLNSSVMVTGNATSQSGSGNFNYGYYIHEIHEGNLSTPGTEKKFLEKSVDESKWQRMLVDRVLNKLRGMGWNG